MSKEEYGMCTVSWTMYAECQNQHAQIQMYSERSLVTPTVTCAHRSRQAYTQRSTPIMTLHRISIPEQQNPWSVVQQINITHNFSNTPETNIAKSVWVFSLISNIPYISFEQIILQSCPAIDNKNILPA